MDSQTGLTTPVLSWRWSSRSSHMHRWLWLICKRRHWGSAPPEGKQRWHEAGRQFKKLLYSHGQRLTPVTKSLVFTTVPNHRWILTSTSSPWLVTWVCGWVEGVSLKNTWYSPSWNMFCVICCGRKEWICRGEKNRGNTVYTVKHTLDSEVTLTLPHLPWMLSSFNSKRQLTERGNI